METDRPEVASFVLDASIATVWLLPDEVESVADQTLKLLNTAVAIVPDLFWREMRNVLLTAHRRKRISLPEVWHSMARLEQLGIITAPMASGTLILPLAERHSLTAYDAAYLALALERRLPLATLDRRLAEAAMREGVEPPDIVSPPAPKP